MIMPLKNPMSAGKGSPTGRKTRLEQQEKVFLSPVTSHCISLATIRPGTCYEVRKRLGTGIFHLGSVEKLGEIT